MPVIAPRISGVWRVAPTPMALSSSITIAAFVPSQRSPRLTLRLFEWLSAIKARVTNQPLPLCVADIDTIFSLHFYVK